MSKRAIEESFPIVEINRLAVPERTAFKPIYTMHKWFARRASCIFRSILLGALKPTGTDINAEFYRDHTGDPDTTGKVILDPFMGGGTTVVEALRLGCKVVGIDLNPIAWFVVKTQVEPVDLPSLDAAFARLVNRPVAWSGKPLRKTLLDLYRTEAPWTLLAPGAPDLGKSDSIYTFWVKSAPCTSPTCRKSVPLFGDYIVAAKSPTIRYYPECTCPRCQKQFDWEIEPAALVADPRHMVHAATYSGGAGRATARWTYAHPDGGIFVSQGEPSGGQANVRHGQVPSGHISCPHCTEIVKPVMGKGAASAGGKGHKPKRKKVPLTVLLCPHTEEVFQWRGELAEDTRVRSPGGHEFAAYTGNQVGKGRFVCPHCGNNDAVIEAIRSLPENEPLPLSAYALQAYAPGCDPRFLCERGDDIHVCRPRPVTSGKRSWAGLKALVRRRAQDEVRQIESGRYGGAALPAPDVRMVLIGKCLEVYSQHYGAVVDWQGEPMPLRAALQDIRLLVEQIASSEHPLPSELENADAITQVWLLALADKREITVDSLSKTTRGIFEVSDLTDHKPPLLHKKRAKGSRSWAILTPAERLNGLREALMKAPPTTEQLDLGIVGGERSVVVGPPLVDVLHLLLASAETGERLDPLISFFEVQRGPLRAALEWLKGRDPDRWAKPCDLLLGFYSDVQLTSLLSPTIPKS